MSSTPLPPASAPPDDAPPASRPTPVPDAPPAAAPIVAAPPRSPIAATLPPPATHPEAPARSRMSRVQREWKPGALILGVGTAAGLVASAPVAGFVVALVGAAAYVGYRVATNDVLYTPDDVEALTGVSVLGVVPKLGTSASVPPAPKGG